MNRLRLVVADDHPLVLAGLRDFLLGDISVDVLAMASSSTELVDAIVAHQPDVAITDFSMPDDPTYGDGLNFISYLLRRFPDVKILVVTMLSNPVVLQSLYKAGVSGVVLKSEDMSKLGLALSTVRTGRVYKGDLPTVPNVSESLEDDLLQQLSPRELEVVRHFIEGKSLKSVSEALNRSIKTVSNQKRSAMRKLNAKNDQDLISYCIRANLFQ